MHMRKIFATIVLVSAGMAAPWAAAASTQFFPSPVYVTLQGSDSVESLPGGTRWDNLDSAHYVAVGPDGKRLLVSSAATENVFVVDAKTGNTLATIAVGAVPQGVEIGPRGRFGLAVGAGTDSVTVIDMQALKPIKKIIVGKTPHNARFTADGKLAYVTLQGGTGVAVLDMRSLAKTGEIPVPGVHGPHNLDLSADGRVLWVRDLTGSVAAVDPGTRQELAVIPVAPGHAGIDVIPGGRHVFTAGIAGHVVDVIDPATFKVIKQIEVGQGPHGVRASADGRWLYVGVTATDKVAVIDTHSLEVVRQIDTHGKLPFWIAVRGND
jgi:YVTN family beta-propeller protein